MERARGLAPAIMSTRRWRSAAGAPAQASVPNPTTFERADYVRVLHSWSTPAAPTTCSSAAGRPALAAGSGSSPVAVHAHIIEEQLNRMYQSARWWLVLHHVDPDLGIEDGHTKEQLAAGAIMSARRCSTYRPTFAEVGGLGRRGFVKHARPSLATIGVMRYTTGTPLARTVAR